MNWDLEVDGGRVRLGLGQLRRLPVRNTYLSMARVHDGQLVEFTEFFDADEVARSVVVLRATAARRDTSG